MLIIVDHRIPREAKKNLEKIRVNLSATLVELETSGLVYPEISGHPDIFFCQTPETLVVSPNLDERYFRILEENQISFIKGRLGAGQVNYSGEAFQNLPGSKKKKNLENKSMTCYNAAINGQFLVHRLEYTDPVILENCHYLKKIAVKQGYTRCNLMLLKDHYYITSDAGIDKVMRRSGLEGIFVNPEKTVLPGVPNGFIGGTLGSSGNSLFLLGSLDFLPEGHEIADFASRLGYTITELYHGPLFDGGGIFFLG